MPLANEKLAKYLKLLAVKTKGFHPSDKFYNHKHIIICIIKAPKYSTYLKFIRMGGKRFRNNLPLFLSTNITLSTLLIPAVCMTLVI